MTVHVFGIRHHGPGCARSLRAALETLEPDVVLVEGPPDAEEVLPLAAQEGMRPPVALLVYPVEAPQRAVFFPFAEFSPEWQALRFAHERRVPARFMDLPQQIAMAVEQDEEPPQRETEPDAGDEDRPAVEAHTDGVPEQTNGEPTLRDDPIGQLALAAGYSDRELWWEHQIEQRQDPTGLFDGILEAMTELRQKHAQRDEREVRREAWMRQTIRAAEKEGFERVAVVCGAWHAPVLAGGASAKADAELLKGLPKTKVTATWIPWTYSRLAYRSGYGAGVHSPGWYDHLWTARDRAAIRWAALAARLLRKADLDASSASVIESVRTAEALAALRDLPMPGLAELNEALLAVLCNGDSTPLQLIHEKLVIGNRLGAVPQETPAVPLQKDLEAQQRSLRLKPTTEIKTLDLDLRKETDRGRSRLLHRLAILGINWGTLSTTGSHGAGTFHEIWQLQWKVEFAVVLIEASVWGNTVESAATGFVQNRAVEAGDLPALTELLEASLLADLPQALDALLARLQAQAAVATDVRHLMNALPPLARVARYGDVRGTRVDQLVPVIDGLFERIVIGLPPACASLDDEAAARMVQSIGGVQESLGILDSAEHRSEWHDVLQKLLGSEGVHGLVRGWACRLLLEARVLDRDELHRRARLALSPAVPPLSAAAWVEGLLRGSGLVLLHEDALWDALNQWLCDLSSEAFTELLPLLRRAFSGFEPPERRAMGEKARTLGTHAAARPRAPQSEPDGALLNHDRAKKVLPVLAHILGVPWSET